MRGFMRKSLSQDYLPPVKRSGNRPRRLEERAALLHVSLYERLRGLRNDSIAVTPQSSHALGSPMSQRECAAFNWPEAGTISHPLGPSKNPIG